MSTLEFHSSNKEEDPNDFNYEDYRIVTVMGVPSKVKAELVANQLKGVRIHGMNSGRRKGTKEKVLLNRKSSRVLSWTDSFQNS